MGKSAATSLREVRRRLAALEERLGRLETGRAPPGDGRAAATPAPREQPRCPGCGLPLRRRAGRCRECGLPLSP
jgi:hypothetical protein